MKALEIPDVHLKPRMVYLAEKMMDDMIRKEMMLPEEKRQKIGAVFLGDLADDWGQQNNPELYEKTFNAVIAFVKKYPDVYFCIGNHDISYVWEKPESGYSYLPETGNIVRQKMKELKDAFADPERFGFVHCIDNTVFSHAGLSAHFMQTHAMTAGSFEDLIYLINHRFSEAELWKDISPIWVRMQDPPPQAYRSRRLQVVGHTPVREVLYDEAQGLLSVDTFSTCSNLEPYGDRSFVVVDTVKKSFEIIYGSHSGD